MNTSLRRILAAEMIGTFWLVFVGTGAIVVNEITQGTITHVGIALTFGLIVMAMIYAIGDLSGAHINPAVTISFWLARRLPFTRVLPYLGAQFLGAFLASGVIRVLFLDQTESALGATLPAGPWWQSFLMEFLLTFLLMFVILNVSTGPKEKGIMAGAAIGSVVALEALFAGPVCGASMNPARSLAPAVVSGHLEFFWIYLTAPVLGALAAIPACQCVQDGDCCKLPSAESCA